jgi:DNA segregation ATPase FtsK/SpoIIIE-like protein
VKANLITRVAFKAQDGSASRLVIGCSDAVSLLRQGDCLVASPRGLDRVQAGWVTTAGADQEHDLIGLRRALEPPVGEGGEGHED